jgi:hypothetical protein
MTPAEFVHHAASERFENYDQYLRHHQAREQSRTTAAESRMSRDTHYLTLLCLGIALYVALDEFDPVLTIR